MAPLPKLPPRPKPKPKSKLPPGLMYVDHNYQMTAAQRLRWEADKKKGRR